MIAALHVRARVRLAQGRVDEAEGALLAAVRLAEERARVEPDLQANLALCLSLLGRHGRAATAYRGAFQIRQHLAAVNPNDEAKQLDLAASHVRLAVLAGKTGAGAPMKATGRALRRVAFIYALAGCAFAVVATVLRFSFTDLDFNPVRAGLLLWSWAWPIMLVLALLWSRDRMRVTLVIGALLLIGAYVAARGNPALDLFGASVPAFFAALIAWAYTIRDTPFLNRVCRLLNS